MGALSAGAATGAFRRPGRLLRRYALPQWRGPIVLLTTMLADIGPQLLRASPLKLVASAEPTA